MDPITYYQSLAGEIYGLRNRLREILDDPDNPNWVADGEWKESVLRTALRRHLPRTVEVGRGFVVQPDRNSRQIDLLFHRADAPVVFRDGDLVVVTPDAVAGIIEVKTSVNTAKFTEAVAQLTNRIESVRDGSGRGRFFGLFAYDSGVQTEAALRILEEGCRGDPRLRIDLVCLGDSHFIKWWKRNPDNRDEIVNRWHSYQFEKLAPGYFLHNVVEMLSGGSFGENTTVWFPMEGNEIHKDGQRAGPADA